MTLSFLSNLCGIVPVRLIRLITIGFILATALVPMANTPRIALASSAITTTHLNLRAGPSTDNYIKLVMPPSASVELLSDLGNAGFYKVAFQGETGYAHADFLNVRGNSGNNEGSDPGWADAGSAVTTSALNLRFGPSTGHGIKLVMPEGAAVTLTGMSDSGFSGVVYNGNNGWASDQYLTESSDGGSSDPGDGDTGSAWTTSSLNLRSGPGTGNAVILVMPSGAEVTLTGSAESGFARIRYNGTSGWASQDYLSTTDPGSDDRDNGDGLFTQDEIIAIIYAAADEYGQSRAAMLAVARCESVLDPYAVNRSSNASGLFQFLPGTWATTPFANSSIFDPVANARATGWMWSVGRRNEWVC